MTDATPRLAADALRQPPLQEWRRGWTVVLAAAAGMAMSTLHVYSTGVFIAPLEAEFGWKRAEISGGLSIVSLVGVIAAPFVGLAIDRFGPRRIGMFGSAVFCLTVGMLSLTGASIWSWFALWALIAFAATSMKVTTWASAVSSVFVKGRGLALSVTFCGTGLGSSLTPIVANTLIAAYGWRIAYAGLAAFWAVLVLPLLFLFFTSAKDRERVSRGGNRSVAAMLTGMTVREGFRSPRFYKLALAAFAMTMVAVSFSVNLVPILGSNGLDRGRAAGIAGILGIASIVGRLTSGYLLDRVNGNLIAAFSALLPIGASLMLLQAPGSIPAAVVAVTILGLSLGAELDAIAYLATRHLGMRSFGVLFGVIAGLLSLSTGLGPLLVSYTYDVTRSYTLVLWTYLPVCVLTAGLLLTMGRYPDFGDH